MRILPYLMLFSLLAISQPITAHGCAEDSCPVARIVESLPSGMSRSTVELLDEDLIGAPVPVPAGNPSTLLESSAASDDVVCPAGFPPASGSETTCEETFSKHKIKTISMYYGDPASSHPTTGINHASFAHLSDSHSKYWYQAYQGGKTYNLYLNDPADCTDFFGTGWHADDLSGGLSPGQPGFCNPGSPFGWWGAGVRFK